MRLYLIRHGATLPTGPDSHEWPLSPEGEAQAHSLADAPFWKNVSALYSSPEGKALATVRPASEKHGLEIHEDRRMREARRCLENPESPPDGWEDAREAEARVRECFEELEERHSGEGIAVCSHGLPSVKSQSVFEFWRSIGFCRVAVVEGGDLMESFKDAAEVH